MPRDGSFEPVPVDDRGANLDAPPRANSSPPSHHARLRRAAGDDGRAESWLLLVSDHAPVLVNGDRVPLGIRVLRNRDELRAGARGSFYFSTEQLASIQSFPGAERPMLCPRCKLPIHDGDPAVQCPNPACGSWHHQSPPDQPCWTYAESCACCAQPTALDAGYQWTPDRLFASTP